MMTSFCRWLRVVAAVALSVGLAEGVAAGTATGTLAVTVTVDAACRIRNATLSFPNYIAGQTTQARAETRLTIDNCTAPNVTVSLNGGHTNDIRNRRMRSASGATLSYQLYRDSSLTAIAGTGSDALSGRITSGTTLSFTIYGVIPQGQWVPPGTYSDTVQLTLEF